MPYTPFHRDYRFRWGRGELKGGYARGPPFLFRGWLNSDREKRRPSLPPSQSTANHPLVRTVSLGRRSSLVAISGQRWRESTCIARLILPFKPLFPKIMDKFREEKQAIALRNAIHKVNGSYMMNDNFRIISKHFFRIKN